MPTKRISMHKIKEVIRLKSAGLKLRLIADAVKLSLGAVAKYAKAAEQAGLAWPLPADLGDDALKRRLFGSAPHATPVSRHVLPDCAVIHQELKRKGANTQSCRCQHTEKTFTNFLQRIGLNIRLRASFMNRKGTAE